MNSIDVGLALIWIGIALLVLSISLGLLGFFYSKKRSSSSHQGYNKKRKNEYSIIPLRLQHDSKIRGTLSVTQGELKFSLEDHFGWIPQYPIEWVAPSHIGWSGHGNFPFEVHLRPGDYMFMFKSKTENVVAKLDYTVTYYIKSLKKLTDLGLVLIQVATPILVTGFVIYAGLSAA